MQINEYFIHIRQQLSIFPYIISSEIIEDIRTSSEGFIKALIILIDGSILSFREYVSTEIEPPIKFTYSYHYYKNQNLIFRYDNAPHHKEISSFPPHKHLANESVISCLPPTIDMVLTEIKDYIHPLES